MEPTGIEPATSGLQSHKPIATRVRKSKQLRKAVQQRAAPGAALSAEEDLSDAERSALGHALAALPKSERAGVVEHVRALARMKQEKRAAVLILSSGHEQPNE